MSTTAIYTVCQHGQEAHFYSYCAGGYSYPFHVADWLSQLDADINQHRLEGSKLSVAPLLPQMTGDYNFPEAAKGLRLFRPVSEAAAADFLGRTAGEEIIPFHITLDLDKETVGFVFNRNCPELNLPDLELPMQGKCFEVNGTMLQESAACEEIKLRSIHDSPFVSELHEKVYEQHIREYAESQLSQGDIGMAMR